jgi:hypothetical protein
MNQLKDVYRHMVIILQQVFETFIIIKKKKEIPMTTHESFFLISQVVVNILEISYSMIQVLFEHVNVQFHLYHFYKVD